MLAGQPVVQLPTFNKPSIAVDTELLNPKQIATQWIRKLEAVLQADNISSLVEIMHADSWWRDMLGFSWDFRTIHGIKEISTYIGENQGRARLHKFKIRESGNFVPQFKTPLTGLSWIESMFDFESSSGNGSGMLRLLEDANGTWKGCMLYTALQEMKDFKELVGTRRPHGGISSLIGGAQKGNWLERRQRKMEFVDEEPTVLIAGAGPYKMAR